MEILTGVFIVGLLAATLRMATPIILAALGEIITERSGILNLGVEGMMLMGAIAGFIGAYFTGNPWIGFLLAIFVGGLMGLLMGFFSITLSINQVLAGIGIYFAGWGLSSLIYRFTFGAATVTPTISGIDPIPIPLLSQIPVVGEILFTQDALVYLMIILTILTAVVLFRTTLGLKIRAVGENPKAADTVGTNVFSIRYLCIVVGGMLAALGGAYLTVAHLKLFWENMTVGRGFIAIAIVYFGKWHPYRTLMGGLLFGFAYALQIRLQAMELPFPHQFLLALPYILVIVILVLVARRAIGPASLATPYRRGE